MAARILVVVLVLAAIGASTWYFLRPWMEPPPMPPAARSDAPAPKAGPQFPIGADAKPLPKLNESDPTLREAIAGLVDAQALARFFNLEDGVRRLVAAVDNLPRETIATRVNPVRPIGGAFLTTGKGESLALAPANAARYTPFIRLVEGVDTAKLVEAYVSLYPLFQQAFVELGYPDGYFNDRAVEVIDHLLEAPEPPGPIRLVTPHVLYEFADPELEQLSAGHKIMVRIGPENAARLKAKLKSVRAELVKVSARR